MNNQNLYLKINIIFTIQRILTFKRENRMKISLKPSNIKDSYSIQKEEHQIIYHKGFKKNNSKYSGVCSRKDSNSSVNSIKTALADFSFGAEDINPTKPSKSILFLL